jgi:hypothetical protein
VFGRRKDKVSLRLQALLEPFDITRYYTDGGGTYERYVDPEKYIVGKEHMQRIESKHINLRTRIKRLERRTIWSSGCLSTAMSSGEPSNVRSTTLKHLCFRNGSPGMIVIGASLIPINPCSWLEPRVSEWGAPVSHAPQPQFSGSVWYHGPVRPTAPPGAGFGIPATPGSLAPPLTALGVRTMGVCGEGGPVRHRLPARKRVNTTMID